MIKVNKHGDCEVEHNSLGNANWINVNRKYESINWLKQKSA